MIAGLIVETEVLTNEQIVSFIDVVFENEPDVMVMYPPHMSSVSQRQANYLSVGIGQMRGYIESESDLIRTSDYLIALVSKPESRQRLKERTEKVIIFVWDNGVVRSEDEKGKERKA